LNPAQPIYERELYSVKRVISFLAALALVVGIPILTATSAGAAPVSAPSLSSRAHTGGEISGGTEAPTGASGIDPSCRSVSFTGSAGYIAVQTSPTGRIAWGIYMYSPENRYGLWVVSVYVGGRQVDRKVQAYEPHGSVASSQGPPGSILSIRASMTNENGEFTSVPVGCVIP
jgi:hypothetical protein